MCVCVCLCVLVTQSCLTFCDLMDHRACQALLSMEFSRQEYWSGLPFPFSGDLSDPGIRPRSPALQADSLPSQPPGKPEEETGVQNIGNTRKINNDKTGKVVL